MRKRIINTRIDPETVKLLDEAIVTVRRKLGVELSRAVVIDLVLRRGLAVLAAENHADNQPQAAA